MPMEDMRTAFHDALATENYSDFTIVCAGHEYKVHRVVIAAHSTWFVDRFRLAGQKSTPLNLEENPDAVKAM